MHTFFFPSDPGNCAIANLSRQSLTDFVQSLTDSCLESVQERLMVEACHLESVALIRALDKIGGKLQAMDNLLPSAGFSE